MFMRPRQFFRLIRRCAALAAFGLGSGLSAEEITVFAAASLKTALDDVAPQFERQTGHDVTLSFAGSSVLARQIELGAPADVFVSANPGWMDHLEARNLIEPGTRADLLSNRLVLVAHGATASPVVLSPDLDVEALLADTRLTMALVDAVPAGIYGKAALQSLELWDAAFPRVVQTDNVRAALALVALGEAGYGIVYATDARAESSVSIAATFQENSHPQIRYPVAILAGRASPAATEFMTFLRGPTARALFESHGFIALGDAG